MPLDRHDFFDPLIVEKHKTRWAGLDEPVMMRG